MPDGAILFDLERPAHLHKGYQDDVLYLDFDGVLHPDDVWRTRGKGIHLGSTALGHQLFESAKYLDEMLEQYPNLRIVLSTSWVRVLGFSKAASYLAEPLRSRIIGATYHSAMPKEWFANLARGEQVRMDICRRRPARWVAIDDENAGWEECYPSNVVLCNGKFGLSEKEVRITLMETLKSKFEKNC